MEVRSGTSGSAANPVRAAGDAAASLATQPAAAAALQVGAQPAPGPGRVLNTGTNWDGSSAAAGCRQCIVPTTAAPAAR